jgi:hypothetical protein
VSEQRQKRRPVLKDCLRFHTYIIPHLLAKHKDFSGFFDNQELPELFLLKKLRLGVRYRFILVQFYAVQVQA